MLKIYNSYYMYQLDHGEWNRFGYTGWFCKEESDVTDLKIILKDATFEQAFERFEKKPDHNIFSSRLRDRYLEAVLGECGLDYVGWTLDENDLTEHNLAEMREMLSKEIKSVYKMDVSPNNLIFDFGEIYR